MNKYQKQINKVTKKIIKNKKQKFADFKYCCTRQSGKSYLEFKGLIEYLSEYEHICSNKYYRHIRKNIKRAKYLHSKMALKSFKMTYDSIWMDTEI